MERRFENDNPHERLGTLDQEPNETRRYIERDVCRIADLALALDVAPGKHEQRAMQLSPAERRRASADFEQIDPEVRERYAAASLILSAAVAVLRDGLDERDKRIDDDPTYVMSKLNGALSAYGLTVSREQTEPHEARKIRRVQRRFTGTHGDTLPLPPDQSGK